MNIKLPKESELSEINALITESKTPREGDFRRTFIHSEIPYSPNEVAPLVQQLLNEQPRYQNLLQTGEITPQYLADLYEIIAKHTLDKFGETVKLSVKQNDGSRTADFKVTLRRDLIIGGNHYRPGDIIIVEVKTGARHYITNEFKTADSHGRQQIAQTMKEHQAQGGVALLCREMQEFRADFDFIKKDILQNEGKNVTILMTLPHENALCRATELLLSQTQTVSEQTLHTKKELAA